MKEKYDHRKIEEKWQRRWNETRAYETPNEKPDAENEYILSEFPYPSGNLHVGHWYAFAVPDILARARRMQGRNVLFPIGFDAFGLPAENAAIKRGLNPRVWTEDNIASMKKQLRSMGASFDTSREVVTSRPEYYRWTQWLFIQLFNAGLVERRKTEANWCPSCRTVLANEQVVGGKCERCGSKVEKKTLAQWQIRITAYADRLLNDLEKLDWPEEIKTVQRNWIGRSSGALLKFQIINDKLQKKSEISNVVMIHGCPSRSEDNSEKRTYDKHWQPWIKKQLEERGVRVDFPLMPSPWAPEYGEYKKALERVGVDENTVLIGHSCGAAFLVRWLGETKRKVKKIILVAPWKEEDCKNETKKLFYAFSVDEKVKNYVDNVVVFTSDNEEEIGKETSALFQDTLDARVIELKNHGHYMYSDMGTEEFPELLNEVFAPQLSSPTSLEVFTTRPDTLFGATYLVLAPEHPLISRLNSQLSNLSEVEEYIQKAKRKTDIERTAEGKEKTGVELKGVRAINPATKEEIPIFVADYVLANYGAGAIMAVPAHDGRDFAFAKKYKIPIRQSIVLDTVQYEETKKVLDALQSIFDEAQKRGARFWVLGGLACVFYARVVYRSHSDIDLMAKDDESRQKLCTLIEKLGYKKMSTGKSAYATFQDEEGVVVEVSSYMNEFGLTDADFEEEIKELNGYRARVLSRNFIKRFKERQLKERNKEKDELDWAYLNGKVLTEGGALVNSGKFSGLSSGEAGEKITEFVGGKMTTQYRLRDWTVSRQRYWGTPTPLIHCAACEQAGISNFKNQISKEVRDIQSETQKEDISILNSPVPPLNPGWFAVPDGELPVELPEIDDYLPREDGKSPLAKSEAFVKAKCPNCGGDAVRETDTLDTFVDSSWYFLRYTDPKNEEAFADKEKMKRWMPVDFYSGGAEHTTMHLLYARFFHKALFDLGLVNESEPYKRRMNRGLILGPDGNKMSKSKGNVIDPDDVVREFGADTLRLYLAFIGPYSEVGAYPWSTESISGMRRFLEKVWRLFPPTDAEFAPTDAPSQNRHSEKIIQRTIKKVTEDIAALKFNTALAALMTLVNEMERSHSTLTSHLSTLVLLLSPFAPHIAEELWEKLGNKNSIFREKWPKYDKALTKDEEITIAIQVNGKVRGEITVAPDISDDDLKKRVLENEKVQVHTAEKEIRKIIVVKGRIVSVVAS